MSEKPVNFETFVVTLQEAKQYELGASYTLDHEGMRYFGAKVLSKLPMPDGNVSVGISFSMCIPLSGIH